MNVEELSIIGPDVDLETVDAINKKRILAFVNHFVINTSVFLNKLSKSCECGLMSLEKKIEKLETSVILLESKLNSVPGLEVKDSLDPAVSVVEPKQDDKTVNDDDAESNKEAVQDEEKKQEVTLDPAHMKYVKMLQFGVPLPAVKLKMEQEEVDPSMFDLILNYNK